MAGLNGVNSWDLMKKQEQDKLVDVPAISPTVESSTASLDAAEAAKDQGTANAIGAAGGMVGQLADPKGVGLGPAVSSGASMGATGFALGGAPGAVIGATIGLGLGLFGASKNREAQKRAADANAMAIMADGVKQAASIKPQFRFGGGGRGRSNI